MKSLMLFLQKVLLDMEDWCRTSTALDLKTIERRVDVEGQSFLTITLPKFAKELEKALEQSFVSPDLFPGFRKRGRTPEFLGGFMDLVFDRASGRLLEDPSVDSIQCIRQFCRMFGKIEDPCSDARNQRAIDTYLQVEQEVRISDKQMDEALFERFLRIGRLMWADVFSVVDEHVYYGDVLPHHGPGATADKLKGNLKWSQRTYPERLEEIFHASDYLFPNYRQYLTDEKPVNYLDPGQELPVRVIHVPKTQDKPRIIAVEPAVMMFWQKALQSLIYDTIERTPNSREDLPLRGFVGFYEQDANRQLAREGSITGTLATLDLSEASDRVSYQHVRGLLRNHPHLASAVDASRSRKADVNGQVIRLAKFASMGSALCFPFEAIVFCTIVFLGIEEELKRPITRDDISSFAGQVRVFGDDIIVPVDYVPSVIRCLEAFGLRVNTNKSFWNGKFRESCGRDYYDGHDISVVYMRDHLPTGRTHAPKGGKRSGSSANRYPKRIRGAEASRIVSTVSLRNQLYNVGFWRSTAHLDGILEQIIPFPYSEPSSPALGRHTLCRLLSDIVWDDHLHRPLIRAMVVDSKIPQSKIEGSDALLKCFSKLGDLPFADEKHLERAGRPVAVDIKQRTVPMY